MTWTSCLVCEDVALTTGLNAVGDAPTQPNDSP
jgi:hypothetical protein